MAGTTVSGIGSGIDTQAIVESLVAAQKAPKQAQINTQTLKATTTLSSIGKIQAALDAFRGALTSMTDGNSFGGLSVKSSDEKVATITTGAGAANGSFSLLVSKLATASKVSTKVYAGGAGSVVNSGTSPTTLTIKQDGKAYDLSVPAGATLQQVRDSINSQFGTSGLSANVLTDASGSRLIVTSTKMGTGSDITLSGNSGIDTGYTVVDKPQDAEYTLDGIAMKSKTNDITDAVSGLNIKLLSTSPKNATSGELTATILSVSTSTTALKSGLKGFIDTYNALLAVVNAETKVTKNADGSMTAAALTGDATMRTMMASIREEMNALSGNGTLKSLAAFGVTSAQDGGALSLDDKKWDKAAATNAADLTSIFNGKDGMLARLQKVTEPFAKASTGTLAERSKVLSESLTKLKTEQESLDARMEALQKSLQDKYNNMDTLVTQLRQQQNSVLSTLNALNKANSDD
ncbi:MULTISPECIES: flagellar filament capping protein FliD [Pseudomonas]|uniref:flagellar filament capping protein FliD n=1 Tax=Pseudomonas TaxID=286 RepID=UPI0007730465|nr:flagellar filament capping protein FliD [Pseudomonas asiatica]KXK69352.1 flagellar cap protein FliD [Pseudomonas monteilii]MEE1903555.1 flagellar filament capping protein FliD [Pseudomonas inefficax]MEE1907265.1 flagellar filament capping protein FliD [Pseudomonas inefficax]MEE1985643.1 flagellar filament capping protein FliD [Pseudomonas inefficax]WJM52143.1 flagellar filament capping protein FliD [Pseudomonas asiatica]